ncbi:RNA polymerase sigma factor [Asticcacaulis sp. W401b]|uniref:RNA polymerase sigma factor n=1 Tax=Asticcacaulis sp. W401b TaxID=3388666 RepID=UPI00397097C3
MADRLEKSADISTDTLSHLYKKYNAGLQRFFFRRVRNRDDAEDLTHDLLIKIAHRTDVEKMENPEGFLFAAATNALRDRARHAKVADGYLQGQGVLENSFEGISPERVLISKQSLDRILLALEKLDERARDVFILHRLEGMKYAEIARMYGLSVSSIEKDMIRAIAHLAEFANL